MDVPQIPQEAYLRTLAHFLRTHQRRLLPSPTSTATVHAPAMAPSPPSRLVPTIHPAIHPTKKMSSFGNSARAFVTPADPMAAAYSSVLHSLRSFIHSLAPGDPPDTTFQGALDGTGLIDVPSLSSPSASPTQTVPSTNPTIPILPLDLYYLLFLLDQFDHAGIDLGSWDGILPSTITGSMPRVIRTTTASRLDPTIATTAAITTSTPHHDPNTPLPTTLASFPPPQTTLATQSTRPSSVRSFSSTAMSTLTLITGWHQWSTLATTVQRTPADDVQFIHQFMKRILRLRLVSHMVTPSSPHGTFTAPFATADSGTSSKRAHHQRKGRPWIEGWDPHMLWDLLHPSEVSSAPASDSYMAPPTLSQPSPKLLVPLAAAFPALTHLELYKISLFSIQGWHVLMRQLQSLVLVQGGIEDVHDVLITAVVQSERLHRQSVATDKARAELVQEEQKEALRDAAESVPAASIATLREDGGALETTRGPEEELVQEGSLGASTSFNDLAIKDNSPGDDLIQGQNQSQDQSQDHEDAVILASLEMWPALQHLSVSDNGLPAMAHHSTFAHTHAIRSLDLSHNLLLAAPSSLTHLFNLHSLNLAHNMISSVSTIYLTLGNIASLDLRGNRLESLAGLERLWNLEKVDVRENLIEDAAEVGRLAALPGIRQVRSEKNPLCILQPHYRLEILAVFKINGHDLILDGSPATFSEKRTLASKTAASFLSGQHPSTAITNVANIPSASAPMATLANEVFIPRNRLETSTTRGSSTLRSMHSADIGKDGHTQTNPHHFQHEDMTQISQLVRNKLAKVAKRAKRVVDLDRPADQILSHPSENGRTAVEVLQSEEELESEEKARQDNDLAENSAVVAALRVLGSPASIRRKKKNRHSSASFANPDQGDFLEVEPMTKVKNKKKAGHNKAGRMVMSAGTSPSGGRQSHQDEGERGGIEVKEGSVDHSLCRANHHVHRLAHLEKSLASSSQRTRDKVGLQPRRPPSLSALQKRQSIISNDDRLGSPGTSSPPQKSRPPMRPSSPIGSFSSWEDGGGADGYRRKIEAMRAEAGSNWLKVLAEMDAVSYVPSSDT